MFARISSPSPRNVAMTGILFGLLVSTATICHADVVTTYTPGKVMPLSGCPTKVDTSPTSKTYGATVPDDQDAQSHGGTNPEAPADDVCALVAFDVPPIPKGQEKTPGTKKYGGYGALVVTFSSPIDGASFFFAPNCAFTTNGVLNRGNANGESVQVQLTSGNYKLGATGATVPNTAPAATFGQFIVTFVYDKSANPSPPSIVLGAKKSFWQSKPSKGFTPNYNGTDNVDQVLAVPEPTFWLPLSAVLSFLMFARVRQKKG